jgi:hypothetical protein
MEQAGHHGTLLHGWDGRLGGPCIVVIAQPMEIVVGVVDNGGYKITNKEVCDEKANMVLGGESPIK